MILSYSLYVCSTGRRVHQSCQCCVRLYAGERTGGRRRSVREGASSHGVDVPVPELQLHGQRDQLPVEAVPGGGQQRQVLGPMPVDRESIELRDVANQQRARILYGDLHRTEGR